MQIKTIKISELNPAKYNPRKMTDEARTGLEKTIDKFGMVQPIIWNERTGNVVSGHQRLKVLQARGETETKCVIVDLPLAEEKALSIQQNNPHITGEYTDGLQSLLAELKTDLPEFDDLLLGELELEIIPEPAEGLTDPDSIPEEVEPITQPGDFWLLGEHRLLCGDATKAEDVERLVNGKKIDMVFTDPPYGVRTEGGRTQTVEKLGMKPIKNDNLKSEVLQKFILESIDSIPLKKNASLYVCYDGKTSLEFLNAINDSKINFIRTLVWKKNVFGLSGKKGYRPQFELIAFASAGEKYEWFGDNSQSDVWEYPRSERIGNHPTPKPVALCAKAIANSSKDNWIVYDAFLGSGSTLIACEQLNRRCFGIEIDPKYCDVIVKRWENFTGKSAECE